MQRRQHSGEFKAKVVLEALRGERTLNEIAADYGVHPLRKRVARLLHRMGLEALYPKPRLRQPAAGHTIYPYLLRISRRAIPPTCHRQYCPSIAGNADQSSAIGYS